MFSPLFKMAVMLLFTQKMWKWIGLFLRKNHLLKCWGWTSSKLDWDSYIISIAKTASKKIGAVIRSMKFLSPEVALYLYKTTICPYKEYCCQVWAGAPSCYLELLYKLYTNMQDCWSFTCCFCWSLGSSWKCGQLKFFL